MAIKHAKTSAKSDGGDSSLVLPSDWNADHTGGPAQSYLGYNTIGGSFEGVSSRRHYIKSVTISADCFLSSIDIYVKGNGSQVSDYAGIVMEDSSGTPGSLLLGHPSGVSANSIYLSTTARWFSLRAGIYLPAATYWVGFVCFVTNGTAVNIAYDSGSDLYYLASGNWVQDYSLVGSNTNTSRKYSIRLNTFTF